MTAPSLPSVDVLVATYNGGNYLADQLDSILQQDYEGAIRLLIRDDGSTDNTTAIINDYLARPMPVNRSIEKLEQDERQARGVSTNFASLISAATAPYMALADQDDVWLSYKIRLQVAAMQAEEKHSSSATPVLICTDLTVVNSRLDPIAPSLWKHQKLNPRWAEDWRNLLVQNLVTGCTTLFNQAAKKTILPIPTAHGIFHDHWMATAVAHQGRVIALNEQTVFYRQHGQNVEAAQHFNHAYRWHKLGLLGQIVRRSKFMATQLHTPLPATTLLWRKLRLNIARLFL